MIFIPLLRSYERKTWTAFNDNTFILIDVDRWYSQCDIFVYDNPCLVGDVSDQDVLVNAGDVYSITTPVNIYDLVFKNYTPGSNTRVVVAGTPMTKKQGEMIGVTIQ